MANEIKMAVRDSIYTLYDRGWSQRRIARELDLDRETVGRHLRLRVQEASKPAIPPAGSDTPPGAGKRSKSKPSPDADPDAGTCQS